MATYLRRKNERDSIDNNELVLCAYTMGLIRSVNFQFTELLILYLCALTLIKYGLRIG